MKPSDEFDLKDANRKKNVDIEDIREINSMNASGQSRTDRIVSREFIDDNQEETPSDGESESEETISRDREKKRKPSITTNYLEVSTDNSLPGCLGIIVTCTCTFFFVFLLQQKTNLALF